MKKLKNGFSIMELIIALAIMGGVAAIGTISVSGVQNRSHIKSDKLMGAEIGHAVVTRETYNSNPISGVIKYDQIPGINKYINKEYKPESMKDGYFVVTKANIDGIKRVMVGITKNNEQIAADAIYDDGKTPGWVWVQGGEIEQLLGKDVDIGGEGCQHNYTSTVTAATCTQQGYTTHTCSKCGGSYKDSYTTATGHSWNEGIVTIEPTYENEGETTFTCTICGDTKTEGIPKLSICEHSYIEISREEATCTQEGKASYECSVCGESYDEIIDKKDHIPGSATTCTTAQICTVCGEIITPVKGHSWNRNTGICSVCGAKCVLASSWANGVTKSNITQISIEDSYNPTGSETVWNGDSGEGLVKVYNTGTKLIIAGSGAGKIYAPQDSSRLFADFSNVTSINLGGLDTSEVTAMTSMFNGCSSLTSLDLSNFVTSNVRNMTCMFSGCSSLTSIDVSKFNTSAVTGMTSMFMECSSLTSIDVSGFNTSAVTTMMQMFCDCSSLTSIDVSGFNTSAVTRMDSMFYGCSNLSSLDVSGFDTSTVTTMMQMFIGCSSLTSMDVSGFNTSTVTRMDSMFYGCGNLSSLDVSGLDTSAVTAMTSMFSGCSSLSSLDVSSFDTSAATTMYFMFDNMNKLNQITIGTEFNFTGNGSASCTLPTPSNTYITGADGNWYTADRTPLTPEEVADYHENVEEPTTYYAICPAECEHNWGTATNCIKICSICGETKEEHQIIYTYEYEDNSSTGCWAYCQCRKEHIGMSHSDEFYQGTVTTEATCTTDGEKEHYCSNCKDGYTETIDALGHDFEAVTTEPTCTEDGYGAGTCRRCGYIETDGIIPALGHDLKQTGSKEATCTQQGYIKSVCSRCGYEYTEDVEIDPDNHDWDEGTITTEATCTNTGIKTYTCNYNTNHKDTDTVPIDPDNHDWDEGKITTKATCTNTGIKTYTCNYNTNHKDTDIVPIDPDNHSSNKYYSYKNGTTHDVHCSACNEKLDNESHDVDNWSIEWIEGDTYRVYGPCVTSCNGIAEHYHGDSDTPCPYCDISIIHEHVYAIIEEVPATCTEAGYVKKVCVGKDGASNTYAYMSSNARTSTYSSTIEITSGCGRPEEEEIPALGHEYSEIDREEATCIDDGHIEFACINCGDTSEETISALGHKLYNKMVEFNDNIYDYGYENVLGLPYMHYVHRYCENCEEQIYMDLEECKVTNMIKETIVTEPTCTVQGYTTTTCKCGYSWTTWDGDPAIGHITFSDGSVAGDSFGHGTGAAIAIQVDFGKHSASNIVIVFRRNGIIRDEMTEIWQVNSDNMISGVVYTTTRGTYYVYARCDCNHETLIGAFSFNNDGSYTSVL